MTDRSPTGRFRIEVHTRGRKDLLRSQDGRAEEWQEHQQLQVGVLGDSYVVDISGVWTELLSSGQDRIDAEAEGLCTIVKWGDTMQLRQTFRIKIGLEEE